ncbi:UNVERIFIED_CONTAM: hypothetical protein K2H54_004250 [Gekko kuhli]
MWALPRGSPQISRDLPELELATIKRRGKEGQFGPKLSTGWPPWDCQLPLAKRWGCLPWRPPRGGAEHVGKSGWKESGLFLYGRLISGSQALMESCCLAHQTCPVM